MGSRAAAFNFALPKVVKALIIANVQNDFIPNAHRDTRLARKVTSGH